MAQSAQAAPAKSLPVSKFPLSKSKIAAFEQCPKRLWLEVHRPRLLVGDDGSDQPKTASREVAVARAAYPNGVLVSHRSLDEALSATAELVASARRRPIFEATFAHDDVLIRTHLLIPNRKGWHLADVRGTRSLKDHHLSGIATQIWVVASAGVDLAETSVRHVDNAFTYTRHGDFEGLFADADVRTAVAPIVAERSKVVAAARKVLRGKEPTVSVGSHCTTPFECPFLRHCASAEPPPPDYPVSLLPGRTGKKAAAELAGLGFSDLRDVPRAHDLPLNLERIHEATLTGKPYHDRAAFSAEIDEWAWPRYYLDFETISFTVPRWLGTRPFQSTPFQFSCHIESENGDLRHTEFLDLSGNDPSRACAESLLAAVGETGSIVAYNAGFERGCIQELARRLPDLAADLTAVAARVVDLLPPVRRHYYHRDMKGSYSIKAVLPSRLPHLSYDALDGVRDGLGAQRAYLEATSDGVSTTRQEELRAQLLTYCELDTRAMVQLAGSLSGAGAAHSDRRATGGGGKRTSGLQQVGSKRHRL
jgi:hypothetical protein